MFGRWHRSPAPDIQLKYIIATLKRRQWNVPVVLDRDGVAAARYEATAIPQTVFIGPDGTVVRVFVGSSRHFEDQLRPALLELTD